MLLTQAVTHNLLAEISQTATQRHFPTLTDLTALTCAASSSLKWLMDSVVLCSVFTCWRLDCLNSPNKLSHANYCSAIFSQSILSWSAVNFYTFSKYVGATFSFLFLLYFSMNKTTIMTNRKHYENKHCIV